MPNNYDHVLSYLLGGKKRCMAGHTSKLFNKLFNNEKEKQQNMNTGLLQL